MKYLNTAGPRLPEAVPLVRQGLHFVVHAPRQTTTLLALARELTGGGEFAALYFSCETGEPAGDDYGAAEGLVLQAIRQGAIEQFPAELAPPPWPAAVAGAGLAAWARRSSPTTGRPTPTCSRPAGVTGRPFRTWC